MTLPLYFIKQQEIRCWQALHNHKLVKRDFSVFIPRRFSFSSFYRVDYTVESFKLWLYVNLNFGCLSHIKRPWSWSVTCIMINYFLQSVVLTGFVFFSQFLWAIRFLFRLNDSILFKFLVFQGFFFRNAFIWINTCSPCGCFVRQLVWWFPVMFCNAGPSHCFLAKKWSTDANSEERITPKLLH